MRRTEKTYYKIGEVSQMLDLPLSTLRFWEKQFTVVSPKRNSAGTRFYTPEDVEKIKMVAYLVKHKGLKLEAAEATIKANASGVSRKYQAIQRLKNVRDRLKNINEALLKRR